MQTEVLYNPDLKTSWVMVPAIIGLILTFIGTIITSIGLVREREAGTLEQLAVMPIKPSTVILGKIAPYFLLAALDMIIVTVLGMLLFDVPFNGNVLAFALGAALFLFVVLGLGVFISTISQTDRAGDPDRVLLPAAADPAVRDDLPARRDGGRGALDRLPAAADLLHDDLAGRSCCAARRSPRCGCAFVVLAVMAVVVFTGATLRFRRDLAPGAGHARGRRGGQRPEQPQPVTAAGPAGRRDVRRRVGDGALRRPCRPRRRHGRGDARLGRRRRRRRRRGQVHPAARAVREVPLDAGDGGRTGQGSASGYLPASSGSWAA